MSSSILLIEDEPQMRSNMRTVLELEGYSVQAVSNGRLGIEALRAE